MNLIRKFRHMDVELITPIYVPIILLQIFVPLHQKTAYARNHPVLGKNSIKN